MKNVLIINGHQRYDEVAEGNLTKMYIDSASEFFQKNGFNVKHSVVESDYDIKEEVEKFVWADYIVLQYPVFWMGVPWITKKYIDEVFSAGDHNGLYINDGRTRSDASKRYGSGGLMQGTKYMISLTYNCPTSEFSDKDGFFDGLSLDEANVATHKTFQFCGAEPLETYAIHDIFKGDLDMDSELKRFRDTLERNFIAHI
ncbi:MAG: NAD(P)H-dependent oxidoreductase [Sulfurovum sp.]|uniref:NAD(P)H-dependent oxidoreductase n=1 Tax=Sulfurovum sp. TaxID=1969726 RepID=UPI002867F60B|nr:NAD(P)H-dependent oxidoreductase [Sulfurovum sp.]MCO4845245.1 NAD(P)H-dependent oxidoreductase [Sulfurovum sp.]